MPPGTAQHTLCSTLELAGKQAGGENLFSAPYEPRQHHLPKTSCPWSSPDLRSAPEVSFYLKNKQTKQNKTKMHRRSETTLSNSANLFPVCFKSAPYFNEKQPIWCYWRSGFMRLHSKTERLCCFAQKVLKMKSQCSVWPVPRIFIKFFIKIFLKEHKLFSQVPLWGITQILLFWNAENIFKYLNLMLKNNNNHCVMFQ